MVKMTNSAALPTAKVSAQPIEAGDEDFKPLTREEAQKLREASPSLSPWRVVAWQLVVGLVLAGVAWALTGRSNVAWSAFYGALAVVIPAALFVRGMGRGLLGGLAGRMAGGNPGGAVAGFAGFVFWEAVKILVTVAMLFAAPKVVASLSWLALVAGFVVTMKVVWVLLLFRLKAKP